MADSNENIVSPQPPSAIAEMLPDILIMGPRVIFISFFEIINLHVMLVFTETMNHLTRNASYARI